MLPDETEAPLDAVFGDNSELNVGSKGCPGMGATTGPVVEGPRNVRIFWYTSHRMSQSVYRVSK